MTEQQEPIKETPAIQDKVDANLQQPNVDATLKQEASTPEPPEDPNWKAFREARKQDRIQKEAAEKRASEKEAEAHALKAAMEAILNKNQPPPQQQQQSGYGYAEEESEDERIEKKVQAALAIRERQAEQVRTQREQEEYPQRLQQHFPDFQQAIATENLDYLEYHFPEVAAPLKRLPDGYDKWHDIYKAVKKFIPNMNARKDAAKADANFNKPKSMSSASVTQPGEGRGSPSILTEERKAANWARMQQARKGLS